MDNSNVDVVAILDAGSQYGKVIGKLYPPPDLAINFFLIMIQYLYITVKSFQGVIRREEFFY